MWSEMLRYCFRWKSNSKSCSFRLYSGKEICVKNQLIALCGVLWAFALPILRIPFDNAISPSNTTNVVVENLRNKNFITPIHQSLTWFVQFLRMSHWKMIVYQFFIRHGFQYYYVWALSTAYQCFWHPCTTPHTLSLNSDEFPSI